MLRTIRKKKGLTQETLGKKIGKHKSYISRLENKKIINNVSIEIVMRLAKELDIDKTKIFLFFADAYIENGNNVEKSEE